MSHQSDQRVGENQMDCNHAGVHQAIGGRVAQYQLQHWVLSRLLTRKIALREKRWTSAIPSTRRPPPRHLCARHDDRENDRLGGLVVATPTQEQIDESKSKVDESARQLELAEEQYRVFRTQIESHCEPPDSHWKLPPWKAVIGLEELPADDKLTPCMQFILRAKRFLVNQGRLNEIDDDGYDHLIWHFRAMEAGLINESQFVLAIINICKDHPMTLILRMKSFLPAGLAINILGPDDLMEQLPTIKMSSWSNTLNGAVTFGVKMTDNSALQVRIEPDEHRMEQFVGDEEEEAEDDHAPFPQAIIDNDARTVREFIKRGIDVEKRYGKVHKSPLMIAASYNRHEIVDILLKEGGANLYGRDDNGEIAFFWASWSDCVESLRILHLAGCDLDDRDTRAVDHHNGLSTVLYKAAANGKFQSVRYLVESGADLMCPNNFNTPPHAKASAQGHSLILDYLLNHEGVELDHRNAVGVTALHMAAQWGELACLNVCLDHTANVEIEDRNGWTPLFCAAWKGQYACIRRLVERGRANLKHISHRDKCGPLIVSVLSDNVETVAYLINVGCDIKEVDGEGDNILHCIAAFGADKVLDYLFEKHRKEVQGLLERRNHEGKTPEEKARQEGQDETAALLAGYDHA